MRRPIIVPLLALLLTFGGLIQTTSAQTSGGYNVGPNNPSAYVVRVTEERCFGYNVYDRYGRITNARYYVVWSDGYYQYVATYSYRCDLLY